MLDSKFVRKYKHRTMTVSILGCLLAHASAAQADYTYNYNITVPINSEGSNAMAINNAGTLAGTSANGVTGNADGFVGTTDVPYGNLSANGNITITGLNNNGAIVGNYYDTSSNLNYFYSPSASPTDTAPAVSMTSTPLMLSGTVLTPFQMTGIDAAGVVFGSEATTSANYVLEYSPGSNPSATVGSAGAWQEIDLTSLLGGGNQLSVNGVSENGAYVVGSFVSGGITEGFLFNTVNNSLQVINDTANGSDPNAQTVAYGVNDSGIVVGGYTSSNGEQGFVYNGSNGFFGGALPEQFVNAASGSAADIIQFNGINDSGVVVGSNGISFSSFTVATVPEPAVVWQMSTALAVLGGMMKRRRKA